MGKQNSKTCLKRIYWFVDSVSSSPAPPFSPLMSPWDNQLSHAKIDKTLHKWPWTKTSESMGRNNPSSFLLVFFKYFVSATKFWLRLSLRFENLITKSCCICGRWSINFKQIHGCCVKIVQETIRKTQIILFSSLLSHKQKIAYHKEKWCKDAF